ncbi:phosphotransferase enzyme family protein [Microlunatus sp. GCM10028923]|uniref:phosphotransferase enzyme family protein n=1 Tax=Microlunatus sp. GCM10028923 TaxID=3273400 RepID=UPI00360F13A2
MDVARLVEASWAHLVREVEPLTGGLNSDTWSVATAAGRFVLKSVPADDRGFINGLELAASLDRHGIATGAPVRTVGGQLFEQVGERSVALLRWVDGEALSVADPRSAPRMGTTLARVHEAGATETGSLDNWLRVLPFWGDFLDIEPWIRPVVENALEAVRVDHAKVPLTWAGLHGDPSPSAFLVRGDDTGLIDWGATMHGPALYDLASAAMYLGWSNSGQDTEAARSRGEALVAAYLKARPSMINEVRRGLALYLRLRLCVQAGYFAWRCANEVRTGIRSEDENREGLRRAGTALVSRSRPVRVRQVILVPRTARTGTSSTYGR